jgi:hypothetical protein
MIKMNPVVLELPDDKKNIQYLLLSQRSRVDGKRLFFEAFYAVITMLSP